ncbi:Calx-beta domain-containing protein [Aliikangiella coralliicola]|uniref:Calx-beta domain-containing protein n=1 Tax=Aliikangiella coralliicola TaxID=2592383 RepID=A0A545UF15_9GAMM|nr:Calx-beta domain-containing protein [Aliikangiella coralliicola]TQV88070.1 hypothetical protein FLL46_09690 [Aliikangiella coralliicola]
MQFNLFILKVRQLSQLVVLLNLALVSLLISPTLSAESGRSDYDLDDDGLIEINDLDDLNEIRNHLDGTALYGSSTGCPNTGCIGFELTTDLDFDTNGDGVVDTNDDYWESTSIAEGWQPIGDTNAPFTAIFEGNDFKILNLVIEGVGSTTTIGLFRAVDGAVFQNFSIEGEHTRVQGRGHIGLLFGQGDNAGVTLSNCDFSGEVVATLASVGGIGGYASEADISNCEVNVSVSTTGDFAGGFLAQLSGKSTISNSVFTGSVSGQEDVGGFIGSSRDIEIYQSYVNADITGTSIYTGGFVGRLFGFQTKDTIIENSFVMGSVSGLLSVGGFIGQATPNGSFEIRNSFSAASVHGEDTIGGIVGLVLADLTLESVLAYGSVTDTGEVADVEIGGLVGASLATITTNETYWDIESTGQSSSADGNSTGLTTSELQCPQNPGDNGCLVTPYGSWSTDDWDFGDTNQYPGLIIDGVIYRDNDADGVSDDDDDFPNDASETTDSDGDGVGDNADAFPNDASETTDSDGDGLGDNTEIAQGMDPNDADDFYQDSDGDHILDGYEVLQGTDLNDANDFLTPLDESVNGGGYFELSVFPSADYFENNSPLLKNGDDGHLYVVGTLRGDEISFYLSRFNADMTIDTNYASDGFVYGYDLGVETYQPRDIGFEADGSRILVLPECDKATCLLALDDAGNLSSQRFTTQPTPGQYKLANSSDDEVLAASSSNGGMLVYSSVRGSDGATRVFRLDENDELDTTFYEDNTYRNFDFYSGSGPESTVAVIETADDEFLLASRQSRTLNFAKIDSQGLLIDSFGSSGIINDVLGNDRTPDFIISDQAGGFIVLTSDWSDDDKGVYLYRLNSDGTIDTNFGADGYAALLNPTDNTFVFLTGIFQQEDGHLLATYYYHNDATGSFIAVLAKLTETGELVSDFGINGLATYSLDDFNSPESVALTDDHNIVMAGSADDYSFNYFLVFANTNDNDGDGVIDEEDAFPNDADETLDSDGDGIGNNADTDDDNDGVTDDQDAFPFDNTEWQDTDGDGIGNNADTDDDNDGVSDDDDAFPLDDSETTDTDGDGVGNNADTDDDNDGVLDDDDAFPLDDSEWQDSDGDGIGDNSDTTPYPYSGDLNFEFTDYVVAENGFSVDVKVTRTNGDYEELTVDYTMQDGADPDSSATATNDYVFVADTLTFADGETEQTITVSIVDDLTYEGDESFTVTLNNLQSTGDSSLGSVATTTITIQEDDPVPPAGEIGFEFATDQVNENDGDTSLKVVRDGGSFGEVSVSLVTQDDSATATNDYVASSQTLTFADGEIEKVITISLVDDDAYESDESFSLLLSNVTGSATLGTSITTVTILDNEPVPPAGVLSIENDSYQINENDTSLDITVIRTGGDFGAVSVDIVSQNDSATSGDDYQSINQTLNFADGEIAKTVTVNLIDDSTYEGDETFNLELTNVVGTSINNPITSTVTILENDAVPPAGVIQFSGATYSVDEGDGSLTVTVVRSNGSFGDASIGISVDGGSATNLLDYRLSDEQLTFVDGETSQSFSILILDDSEYEGEENLTLRLTHLNGDASLGSIEQTTIIIVENDPVPASGDIQLSGSSFNISESFSELTITVLRANGSFGDISVDYEYSDGTAINGEDFNATNGTLFFADGETSQTITIGIVDDSQDESDESFEIALVNPVNTIIAGEATATINISDNDETEVEPEVETESSSGGGSISWLLLGLIFFARKRFNLNRREV